MYANQGLKIRSEKAVAIFPKTCTSSPAADCTLLARWISVRSGEQVK